jgi:hypothetical protein
MKNEATGETALTLAFVVPGSAEPRGFFSPFGIRLQTFD